MTERRASPGSRARRSWEICANRCSRSSSSARSSAVIFCAATSVASASSSARTMKASCNSSREIVRTRTPRFGTKETSPSAASLRSASRIGVRETLNCSESCSWRRTVPGSSSPETIASSITSAMSSALVLSRLMRRVYAEPSANPVRLRLPEVPHRTPELELGLAAKRPCLFHEAARPAARPLSLRHHVAGRKDRLACGAPHLVLGDGQRHPLPAVGGSALAEEVPRLLLAAASGEVEALDGHPRVPAGSCLRRGTLASLVRHRTHPVESTPDQGYARRVSGRKPNGLPGHGVT